MHGCRRKGESDLRKGKWQVGGATYLQRRLENVERWRGKEHGDESEREEREECQERGRRGISEIKVDVWKSNISDEQVMGVTMIKPEERGWMDI